MELKLAGVERWIDNAKGLNRTFMELKQENYADYRRNGDRLNRTFMELKQEVKAFKVDGEKVLIEPLWN